MLYDNVEISIAIMLVLMLFPPLNFLIRWRHLVYVKPYLGGVNVEDSDKFMDSFGSPRKWSVKNYYIEEYFGEKRLMKGIILTGIFLFILMFFMETL